jgi:hypothetical protein
MRALLVAFLFGSAATGCAAAQSVPIQRDTAPLESTVVASATCAYGEKDRCAVACDAGDPPSCNNLGAMYESGVFALPDEERAYALYVKACTGGAIAGCANGQRLSAAKAARAGPSTSPAVAVSPSASADAAASPPAPTVPPDPPAPVAVAACSSQEDCRMRCAHGEAAACDELPGIHISGNVQIYGNVTMFGDVYMNGKKTN